MTEAPHRARAEGTAPPAGPKGWLDTARVRFGPLVVFLAIAATIFLIAALVIAAIMVVQGGSVRDDAIKLVLQFLLITGVGGILIAGIGALRDREATQDRTKKDKEDRVAARIAALQALDQQLGKTYRELKAVKRQLRSLLVEAQRDEDGKPGPPYAFPTEPFRKCMGELLAAQIRAEDIRDHISVRGDLFDPARLERIRARLRYATRFFHDVHEDLERGKVVVDGGLCRTGGDWSNIDSLINGRSFPEDLPGPIRTALETYLQAEMTMTEQHAAIDALDRLRKEDKKKKRRFRAVADDCFALASAEIRQAIAMESGASGLDDPYITHRSYTSSARAMDAAPPHG
jgi:hypothetical protein